MFWLILCGYFVFGFFFFGTYAGLQEHKQEPISTSVSLVIIFLWPIALIVGFSMALVAEKLKS